MRRLVAALLLTAGLVTGCGSGQTTTLHAVGSSAPASGADTCAEVRAGIDAFNAGDYTGTVAHFEKAVPLAEAAARTDSSKRAQDLLAAVRYYATLAPADYLEASAHSPDFATYKAITLTQCASGASGSGPGGSGGVTI